MVKQVGWLCIMVFLFNCSLIGSVLAIEECDPDDYENDPDDVYCQAGNFEKIGDSIMVEVLCPDDNGKCCNFMEEKYSGERGCCASPDCMVECIPFAEDGFIWSLYGADLYPCEGAPNDYPYGIVLSEDCTGTGIDSIDKPVTFCGNCDRGDSDSDVCVGYRVLFNPNLSPAYCQWRAAHYLPCGNYDYDCLGADCWNICGSEGEALLICDAWESCFDAGCVTL